MFQELAKVLAPQGRDSGRKNGMSGALCMELGLEVILWRR